MCGIEEGTPLLDCLLSQASGTFLNRSASCSNVILPCAIFASAVMRSSFERCFLAKDILPEEDAGCQLLSWKVSGKSITFTPLQFCFLSPLVVTSPCHL